MTNPGINLKIMTILNTEMLQSILRLGKWLVVMYSTYVCCERAKTCRKKTYGHLKKGKIMQAVTLRPSDTGGFVDRLYEEVLILSRIACSWPVM